MTRPLIDRIPRVAVPALLLVFAAIPAAAQDEDIDELLETPAPETVKTIALPESVDMPHDDLQSAPARRSSRMIDEIVVTAQKREENLQDVPISVQAFNADMLDARGIEEPKALQLAVPGMSYTVISGYSIIYIRGVGTDAYVPSADASIATYIDNVYYPFGHGLASALGAVERVEVLKGPQGTLFGRNSTGGAINIVTRQPGPDAQASVLASRQNHDKTNLRAYVNVPLGDDLAVSLSGLRYSEESHYRLAEASSRRELPDDVSEAYALKLGWSPGDLQAVLGYSYLNTRGVTPMMLPVGEVTPLGRLLGVEAQPDYLTGEDAPTYIDSVSRVLTADLRYALPWFDLRFIGADQRHQSPALADFDGSNQPIAVFNTTGQFADVRTAELQLISNADSWGADWLEFIAGLYYIDSRAGFDPVLFSAGSGLLDTLVNPPPSGLLSSLRRLTAPTIGLLNRISDATGLPLAGLVNNGVALNLKGILGTESTAGFLQATADVNDWMSLTLGARYQVETRTLEASSSRLAPNPDDSNQIVPLLDFARDRPSEDTSNLSPKAVVDFRVSDDDMIYLSWSKGFKSGTYNIVQLYLPGQFIVPEEVTAYEVGYKGTLLDGALRFNAAVFENRIDNLQVQSVSLLSGGAVRLETAGAARIRGVDFDLLWQLFPASAPGLVLSAGGAYLDAIYTDYQQGSGYDETTGIYFDGTVFPARDYSGNRIARTPEWSGTLGLNWAFDLDAGTLELGADAYHNGGAYFTAQNRDSSKEEAYTVVNARISYLHAASNLRVTAFGRNLNDARYHYNLSDFDFGSPTTLAPPATYGVRLNWDF